MKKQQKIRKSSISKQEFLLFEKVRKMHISVFRIKDLEVMLKINKTNAYNLVAYAKKKGLLKSIKPGAYIFTFLSEPELMEIATRLYWPSYISLWTALSYYKFTEQMPNTVFVVTTKVSKEIKLKKQTIQFVKVDASRFFGYTHVNRLIIAEKEKALIDSLLFVRYAGGTSEVIKSLYNAWPKIDGIKLVEYALKIKDKSLLKRLGFIIEKAGLRIEKTLIKKLHKNIGKGYSKLDPLLEKKGKLNKRWLLIINNEHLFDWRVIL